MKLAPGLLIRKSSPGFVVWDGWPSKIVPDSKECFCVKDIVGYGTTQEAAEAVVRLFSGAAEVK